MMKNRRSQGEGEGQCECLRIHLLPSQALEKQLDDPSGNRLDAYEIESTHERSDVLQDLAEFQLAAVGPPCLR